jgi:hypothetical protein
MRKFRSLPGDSLNKEGLFASDGGLFPLTPALSRGERGNGRQIEGNLTRVFFVGFLCVAIMAGATLLAQDESTNGIKLPAGETMTNYSKTIELRTADILKLLPLTDPAKTARVHDIIVDQYRALKTWHGENDARLKAAGKDTNAVAEIKASLKVIHDQYLAKLAPELTPEQVDIVKDKMVYNKVQVTFKAYCDIIPVLTDAQKAHILDELKQAREEAIDGATVNEKSAIFKKYKGRIANYLSQQGVDEQKYRKEWYAKYKNQTTTNSAPQP